ncbi:hypothetical protein BAUCODRAFT_70466 [Baudoinia panamericana UAMH 10762]|uniref:Uncharacterized protein n=1 Tax=Baudoinia panamericana (strain UAMH 10762) TaxID=717646 RepID=M2MIT8_BAUPA|nr:uncharacterized protein BAUCODRAFT_70466 [Baudoinia panamericana UAMH 10762]EMC96571.1 hypothetical protein BAUCODRAFT_70466 [Baudoinia panamericana UAMH 10762]
MQVVLRANIYIRIADPVYAMSIGVAAAFVRIRREEKEKDRTTQQSIDGLRRRVNVLFEKSVDSNSVQKAG